MCAKECCVTSVLSRVPSTPLAPVCRIFTAWRRWSTQWCVGCVRFWPNVMIFTHFLASETSGLWLSRAVCSFLNRFLFLWCVYHSQSTSEITFMKNENLLILQISCMNLHCLLPRMSYWHLKAIFNSPIDVISHQLFCPQVQLRLCIHLPAES